jgi:hypothetical protein
MWKDFSSNYPLLNLRGKEKLSRNGSWRGMLFVFNMLAKLRIRNISFAVQSLWKHDCDCSSEL